MSDKTFWQIASESYLHLEQSAPEGLAPVLEVYVDGSTSPIPVASVRTSAEHDWVMLVALTQEPEEADPQAGDLFVLLHSHRIARVELRYVRDDGREFGFTFAAE